MSKVIPIAIVAFGVFGPLFFVGTFSGWNLYVLGNALVAVLCAFALGSRRTLGYRESIR